MGAEAATLLAALRQEMVRSHPGEAAGLLEHLSPREVAELLASEPPARAAAVLQGLSPDTAARALAALDEQALPAVASAADPVRLAPLLARLPAGERERRFQRLEPRLAAELREIMTYDPETAGALMDVRVTTFRTGTTAGQALDRLRAQPEREFEEVFLVDEEGRLVGSASLEALAVAAPERRLEEVARREPASVAATASLDEVLERLPPGSSELPVVDFEGRLLGLIRPRRLLDAAQEQLSADVQTMVGASREERALSPVGFAVRKRLPWLNVNLATAFAASAVVGLFEDTIARITALAVLMPVVAGQSGNSGAQALAVTMRGLALREVRAAQWARIAVKELGVGILNGLAIAVVTAGAVYLWSRSAGLALVIGLAMVVSMSVAGLAGAAVPLALKSLGQDPAQASSIVLTTITDVVGFLSFLGLASLLARAISAG